MVVAATIHNTLGVLYIMIVLTAILYGIGCIQAWYYYQKHSERDYLAIKALVVFVLACDTIQQGMICAAVYKYAVTNHGDPFAMARMESTIIIELYFGAAITFTVQHFYCWRIWQYSHSWLLSGFVSAGSFVSLVLSYVFATTTLHYMSLGELVQQSTLTTASIILHAVTDVAITTGMIYYLQRSKTESLKQTRIILNRLIMFTFNTNIPTTICAMAVAITLNMLPNTFVYMSFYVAMNRLYTNSLLVTLNSRGYIRKGTNVNNSSGGTIDMEFLVRSGNTTCEQEPISIHVVQTTDVGADNRRPPAKAMSI